MITIDPLDDDLPKGDQPVHVDRLNKPLKGRRSPQAERSPAQKRGGLLGILARLMRRNTRES